MSSLGAQSLNSEEKNTLWSAADKGDTKKVAELLKSTDRDVNQRNCLGCTPLLYACGSGHLETVKLLLTHSNIDVNRRNNDRLTSFMLAMQGGPMVGRSEASNWRTLHNNQGTGISLVDQGQSFVSMDSENEGTSHDGRSENAQQKMRRLIDLPATDELEWSRHDRWTALMEACNFGHRDIVELLLSVQTIDLEAVNLRGQRAEEVASSRGYDHLARLVRQAREDRENPEELSKIKEMEQEVENLKMKTRQRLVRCVEMKYSELHQLKDNQENEIEPLTQRIDLLQSHLEEAMKQRLSIITRHVREIKNKEEEIRQVKRKLENFDRYACGNSSRCQSEQEGINYVSNSQSSLNLFGKDFECSICLDDMRPPTKIFQCRNGHVMCENCKNHPDVRRCPSCRIQLRTEDSLLRNIPMEKLALSYFQQQESEMTKRSCSRSSSLTPKKSNRDRSAIMRLNAGGLSQSSDAFLDWNEK